ncbi:hypothetical protein DL767_000378 [Monosporascus sp. MG133]|nr:hypothetical protein DL767_000378 [Monosporascus sp. MG133]
MHRPSTPKISKRWPTLAEEYASSPAPSLERRKAAGTVSAILSVCIYGDVELVKRMLDMGVPVDFRFGEETCHRIGTDDNERGADVNQDGRSCRTSIFWDDNEVYYPLHSALALRLHLVQSESALSQTISALLDMGADRDVYTRGIRYNMPGSAPLSLAVADSRVPASAVAALFNKGVSLPRESPARDGDLFPLPAQQSPLKCLLDYRAHWTFYGHGSISSED